MSEMLDIAATGDIEEGGMKGLSVKGGEILLARVGGEYYAVDNTCPHMKGRLSDGTLEGYTVTCPRHGSQFDVRNGQVVRWLKGSGLVSGLAKAIKPSRPIKAYKVEVVDDRIRVEI